jgi:hypothetical protein
VADQYGRESIRAVRDRQGDIRAKFIHGRARLEGSGAERLKKNFVNGMCTGLSGVVDGVWNARERVMSDER